MADSIDAAPFEAATFDGIYRREVGRCIATLVRVVGDVDLAEDAVAEAFSIAASRWPDKGVPANPGGWITTTARNRAIDHLRRESTRDARQLAAYRLAEHDEPALSIRGQLDAVPDDQLRLIFLCCHPALGPDAQVALTLRLLGGLQTAEIARAFLVPEATMAQRLVRAKRKIRDTSIAYRIPEPAELADRLVPVLAALYLIFNEGHTASVGDALDRPDLAAEAKRLATVLVELLPDEPEALGLLALMLLTEARRPARVGDDGTLIRLADQDRTTWDRSLIDRGHALVRDCLRRGRPGPYQLQAAIAAVHADAATAADTDWHQIVALYDQLYGLRPDAIVALNRAIAIAERDGPRAGVDALAGHAEALADYHLYHAATADLLARLDRPAEAIAAYDRALALTTNAVERAHLRARMEQLAASILSRWVCGARR